MAANQFKAPNMWFSILLIIAATSIATVAIGVAGELKPFGKEWRLEKGKFADDMVQDLTIQKRCHVSGNTVIYTVPMEFGSKFELHELRDVGQERYFSISSSPMTFEFIGTRKKGAEEKLEKWQLQVGMCLYFDIDGDGYIDAMVDNRILGKEISSIMLDGAWVKVEPVLSQFSYSADVDSMLEWGVGRKVRYMFKDGKWHEKK